MQNRSKFAPDYLLMSNLKDFSILVTGARGFLGSVVMAYLKQHGARVIGIGRPPLSQDTQGLIAVDLEELGALKALDLTGPYDVVIHCAALLPGKRSDLEVLIANQRMTHNLLQWAVNAGVSHLLFASGCNIYGYSNRPCAESTLPDPPNYYAVSKLACEYLVSLAAKSAGMRVCTLRISAPYGPHLRAETVVKRFILQAARKEPITLMGSGSRSQDFVYEEDVARAFALAILHGVTGTFNISSNRSVSMRELAETILRLFGIRPEDAIRLEGIDPQEEYRGRYPISAAIKAFGYRPQVTLEEGLRRTAEAWGLL